MKKRINIIVILCIVFCLSHQVIAQEKVKPELKPEVKIDNPVFVFESIPEGAHVLHEFIIKNTGTALLHIKNVLPP